MMNPLSSEQLLEAQISYAATARFESKSINEIVRCLSSNYLASSETIKAFKAAAGSYTPIKTWNPGNTVLNAYLLFMERLQISHPERRIIIQEGRNCNQLIVRCANRSICHIQIQIGGNCLSLEEYIRVREDTELLNSLLLIEQFPISPNAASLALLAKTLQCKEDRVAILSKLKDRGFPLEKCLFALIDKSRSSEILQLCGPITLRCLDDIDPECQKAMRTNPDYLYSEEILQLSEKMLETIAPLYSSFAPGRADFYLQLLSRVNNKNLFPKSWNLKSPDWAAVRKKPEINGPYLPFPIEGLRHLWLHYPVCRVWLRPFMREAFTPDQIRSIGVRQIIKSVKDFSIPAAAGYIPTDREVKELAAMIKEGDFLNVAEVANWMGVHLLDALSNQERSRLKYLFTYFDLSYFPLNHRGETLIHVLYRVYSERDFYSILPHANTIADRYGEIEDRNGVSVNALLARVGLIQRSFEDRAGWTMSLASLENPYPREIIIEPNLPLQTPLGNSVFCLLIRRRCLDAFLEQGYVITKSAAQCIDRNGNSALLEAIKSEDEKTAIAILDYEPPIDQVKLAILLSKKGCSDRLAKNLLKRGFNPYTCSGLVLRRFQSISLLSSLLSNTNLYQSMSDNRLLTIAGWTDYLARAACLELIPFIVEPNPIGYQFVRQFNQETHKHSVLELLDRSSYHQQVVLNWYFTPAFPQPMLLEESLPEIQDFSAGDYFICLEQIKGYLENPNEIKEKIQRILSIVEEKKPFLGLPNVEKEPEKFFQVHKELSKLFTLFLEKLKKLPEEEMASALLVLSDLDKYCAERWFEFLSEYLQTASPLAPKESFKEYLALELQTYRDTLLNQLTADEDQQVHVMHMFHRKWGDELGMPRTRAYLFDDPVAPNNTAMICSVVKEKFCKIYHQKSIEIACRLAKKKPCLLIDWQRKHYPVRDSDDEEQRDKILASGQDFSQLHHVLHFMIEEGFMEEAIPELQKFIVLKKDQICSEETEADHLEKRQKTE